MGEIIYVIRRDVLYVDSKCIAGYMVIEKVLITYQSSTACRRAYEESL